MPPERRTFAAARPVKTERTHEENQERAYIAASRRSDRSLEARIESARRASEIHKKRTGRALRVTEQDVINEEMYEEEDDDLPTQYQRLNAHLHTTSVMFNKKLHDYIATQHGVRNMFMSQYQNPSIQYGQFAPSPGSFPQLNNNNNNWLNPTMPPPPQFHPSSPQPASTQASPHFSPGAAQQHGFRSSPYQIPRRTNSHQRSLSIQLPQAAPPFDPSTLSAPGAVTAPQESLNRRMSLPVSTFNQQSQPVSDDSSRPSLSRTSTNKSATPKIDSPVANGSDCPTPQFQSDADTDSSLFSFNTAGYPFSSQALDSNPLSMSLPPESQQFVGSVLDPNDPRTALFMAGSDNLPQPFSPSYTYNPNSTGKTARPTLNQNVTLAPASGIKVDAVNAPSCTMPTSISEGFFSSEAFLTPGNGDYSAFFDFQSTDFLHPNDEQGDGSNFVNWD